MMMFVTFLDSDAPEMKMTDFVCLIAFLVDFLFLILPLINILGTLDSLHPSQYKVMVLFFHSRGRCDVLLPATPLTSLIIPYLLGTPTVPCVNFILWSEIQASLH